MYRERLTSDELDVLLTSHQVPHAPSAPAASCQRETDTHMDEALADLHASFADDLSTLLSDLARREVVVKLREIVRGTYGQFVFGHTVPTCCAVVLAVPIQTEFFLAIRPSILFPLLDRALGCDLPDPAQRRPLTEIESALSTLLVEQMLGKYREAWQQVLSLELSVDRLEFNTQQMRAMSGSEPVCLVRYDVRCARDQGWVELCIPWKPTQRMRERLAANR